FPSTPPAPTQTSPLSLHDALPISVVTAINDGTIKTPQQGNAKVTEVKDEIHRMEAAATELSEKHRKIMADKEETITAFARQTALDRKSTRLNSSHVAISYAVFCLK